jgi:hypothetical protein
MSDDPNPDERSMCKHWILAERDRCVDVVEMGRRYIGVLTCHEVLDWIHTHIEAITP